MIAPDAFTRAESQSDYFATEIHYRAIAERIVGAVHDGCCFIIVTGDLMPDPPNICTRLKKALNQQRPVMVLFSRPDFRADELLLVSRRSAARKRASHTRAAAPASPLFIFDDAGQLTDRQIEDVYEKSQSNAWIVVLLGRSDFFARLKQHDFPIRWDERTRFLRFDELGRSEILQYIEGEIGGSEAVHVFNDDVVAVIWSHSRGDPRIVNRAARRLLDAASKTADLADPGLALPPAPEPARKAFDQPPSAGPETPVELPKASLPKLDAAIAPDIAVAGPRSIDGDTRGARDQTEGQNPATPVGSEELRQRLDAAIGADIQAAIPLPADQDAPAASTSMSWSARLAAAASFLPRWRHTTSVSWPRIVVVFCLVGVGLVGTVVLDLRGNNGPAESGNVGSSLPNPLAASLAATKPAAPAVPAPPAGSVPPPSPIPEENVVPASTPFTTALPVGPTSPPVAALVTVPAPAPPDAAEVAGLVRRGDEFLGTGDVTSARLYYERAAAAGDALAALRLGESFDPDFLGHVHIRGVPGDRYMAIIWYRRARELGSTEAEILLKSVDVN